MKLHDYFGKHQSGWLKLRDKFDEVIIDRYRNYPLIGLSDNKVATLISQ